jgi:hypothetical protein
MPQLRHPLISLLKDPLPVVPFDLTPRLVPLGSESIQRKINIPVVLAKEPQPGV